ncbi:hypothetical protein Pelo_14459 [Pelomyxa schiedti]|nr:hypothetical protein Pelo_14459 [Pelomyxa schiedti]
MEDVPASAAPWPTHFKDVRAKWPEYSKSLDALGNCVRQGPLDVKTQHLIQMAAAIAISVRTKMHVVTQGERWLLGLRKKKFSSPHCYLLPQLGFHRYQPESVG